MSDTIIVAVISLVGTLGGSYMGVKASNKLIAYRIQELENKVNKHNNIIERTFKLEERQAVTDEQIKVANNRIKDLEEKEK
ncbi:MAG: hypothetical protein K0S47_3212 [Herbinix sp.]|jgi:hypothetical protein|nr:hypothetical protein [Herbinix sp.]